MQKEPLIDIELFAGGGGMAVGLKEAGFSPALLYEIDPTSCQTLRNNSSSESATLDGQVLEGPVEQVQWPDLGRKVRLLAAGAPCQPFSLAGKHRADKDGRNLFPEVLRAVHELRPMAVFIENVRGLARKSFRGYFEYIRRQLEYPSLRPAKGESWQEHDARIQDQRFSLGYAPEYRVDHRLVEAADYGVPQRRQRIFIVATRIDLPPYAFPRPTHSQEALTRAQESGTYWETHNLRRPNTKQAKHSEQPNELLPWCTVRDAIGTLPGPAQSESASKINHWSIPGARSYAGHSGSAMDQPAKTIKAGVHGVPGGENTVTDDSGCFRYFTLRETARLQTFPDAHVFAGARIHVTRQIGNAVPCDLAKALARPLFQIIERSLAARRRENDR